MDLDKVRKLKSSWVRRDSRMKADRALLRFEQGRTKEGFEEVVLNEPKVLYNTCVGLLSGNVPKISLPIHFDASEEEQTKMSKVERFLQGIIRQLDSQSLDTGRGQWLRELAYWVSSGWVVIFPRFDEKGEPHADFYDPITIYPRWTESGLKEVARVVNISGADAITMAETWGLPFKTDPDAQVELINYWEQKADGAYNTICFNGKEIKEETREFDKIPILIGLANGSPERDDPTKWREDLGQSVLSDNRLMYPSQNRWISMLMQIIADTAYPPIKTATASGEPIIGKDDMGSGVVIPTKIGEEIVPMQYAGAPIEVNTVLSILSGCVQRGGMPYVIYGGLPFELSGFAISQLMAAVQYKISPYIKTMEQVLARLCNVFIEEFRLHGKALTLSVARRPGEFYVEDFTKSDIPIVRFVEVTIPSGTPQDKMQQILTARQALQPPAVLSKQTLWENYMDVEDSQLEMDRILDDQIRELPVVKMLEVVEDLRVRALEAFNAGNQEEARVLNGYAQMILNQLMQGAQGATQQGAAGGRQGQPFRQGAAPTPEQIAAARGER